MAKQQKVTKILAPAIPLVLKVEDFKLELKLSWTMGAVILIESGLRKYGKEINVLQHPEKFWTELDCTMLAIAVWALAQQTSLEYADDDGFDVIASYLTVDNYEVASLAINEAFMESLSDERRAAIKKAMAAGEKDVANANPTLAPEQS